MVARSNTDLQWVIDQVVATDGISSRTPTVIALATQVSHRVLPLVREMAARHRREPCTQPGRVRHLDAPVGTVVVCTRSPDVRSRTRERSP